MSKIAKTQFLFRVIRARKNLFLQSSLLFLNLKNVIFVSYFNCLPPSRPHIFLIVKKAADHLISTTTTTLEKDTLCQNLFFATDSHKRTKRRSDYHDTQKIYFTPFNELKMLFFSAEVFLQFSPHGHQKCRKTMLVICNEVDT